MSCQVPLEPGDYNGRVDLGFSGRGGAAYPRSPKGGKGVTICQYRLSSERGRELWKGVMDRRKGRENGGERKTEKSEVKRKLGREIKETPTPLARTGSCYTER